MIELFKYCHENNIIDKFYTHKELKETKENILRDEPDEEITYYLNYVLTGNYVYDFNNNKSYYICTYRYDLRSHQVLIDYIFERGIRKIIVDNTFTPYFYNVLLRLDFTKYCDEIVDPKLSDELGDLIDSALYENIINFKFENKLPRHFKKDIDFKNYIIFKNGFKFNDKYYRFKFDTNITKDNLYDILNEIDKDNTLLDFILFDDINDKHSDICIDRIKLCYKWEIDEYDGKESVIPKLPYEDIIEDLLHKLWKTENYSDKSILTNTLIDKTHTLKDLKNKMWKD
jgi:hypothetical protein